MSETASNTEYTRADHKDIRIGTLTNMGGSPDYIRQILPLGFESFELTIWRFVEGIDLKETAKQVLDVVGDKAVISSVGIYGNPLQDEQTALDWAKVIDAAPDFGATVVCGFAGALEDRPIDENIEKFAEVFGPLAKRAADKGLKIAFENCEMGGSWDRPKWNIAHSPRAWEMMFDSVPGDTLGLEWEPCHQMVSLIDPIANLRKWAPRVYHVHGKDATIGWDIIKERGWRSGETNIWHRTPGFGDTNWYDVITILRQNNFVGAIDIEGWHDPIYSNELEMTGQKRALDYLKECRGGDFVPNPK